MVQGLLLGAALPLHAAAPMVLRHALAANAWQNMPCYVCLAEPVDSSQGQVEVKR